MVKALVEPNWLDKVITFVSPAVGRERQRARTMLALGGGYTGARYDRRETREWFTRPTSADEAALYDLTTLRARSRDLFRNNPVAGGAILNAKKNAVGTGLSAHPTPALDVLGWDDEKGEEWSDQVFREFEMWAQSQDSDITRYQNFYESQGLVFQSVLESGDCIVMLPMVARAGSVYKTRFQVVEADRLASPAGEGQSVRYGTPDASGMLPFLSKPIIGGVEKDDSGAPLAYYILRKHPSSIGYWAGSAEWDRFAAFGGRTGRRNVLHILDRERPDQTRGIPYLAPVVEALKQLSTFGESELMAAVVTSMFTAFITSPDDQQGIATPGIGTQAEMKLGTGTIGRLLPGEEVTFADPKRPNGAFEPFFEAIVKQIAVRLEQPFEALMMHFQSSYSAARAALLEAWKFYYAKRTWLATRYCQPVFEAWMDEAVAIGRIQAPGYFADSVMRAAYQRCEWVGDAPGQIDPEKEVDAAKKRVDLGTSTLQIEAMAASGRDWKDIHKQRAREHDMRVEDGLEPPVLGATATEPVTATVPNEAGETDAQEMSEDKEDDGDE